MPKTARQILKDIAEQSTILALVLYFEGEKRIVLITDCYLFSA